MAVMVQILIVIIQVNLVPSPSEAGRRQHKLTIAIKICAINQPFLGRQLGFHNFFILVILNRAAPFFTAWLFLSRFHFMLQVDEDDLIQG